MLTFMFTASHLKHYLDLHGIGYTYAHVEDGLLLEGQESIETRQRQLSSLIDVYEGPLNDIGKDESALSKSWFRKNRSTGKARHLFNNARNMLMNRYKSGVDEAMWTCFRDEKKRLGLKGYATAFCACNSRATNEYRHRRHLAYLVNVYDHPYIVRWFAASDIHLDAEAFALSQLLQWLWRSALREGESVTLYIPSSRMRRLLCEWLGKTTT